MHLPALKLLQWFACIRETMICILIWSRRKLFDSFPTSLLSPERDIHQQGVPRTYNGNMIYHLCAQMSHQKRKRKDPYL